MIKKQKTPSQPITLYKNVKSFEGKEWVPEEQFSNAISIINSLMRLLSYENGYMDRFGNPAHIQPGLKIVFEFLNKVTNNPVGNSNVQKEEIFENTENITLNHCMIKHFNLQILMNIVTKLKQWKELTQLIVKYYKDINKEIDKDMCMIIHYTEEFESETINMINYILLYIHPYEKSLQNQIFSPEFKTLCKDCDIYERFTPGVKSRFNNPDLTISKIYKEKNYDSNPYL